MQDILLEPYGGRVLLLPVGATTVLTAMLALGSGIGLAFAARWLSRGADAHRVAGVGSVVGVVAFCAVIFAAPRKLIGAVQPGRHPHRAWRGTLRTRHPDRDHGSRAAG